MRYFDVNGVWFPADDPTNAVGGTFDFSSDGIKLALLGSFREGWSPDGNEYPLIHGVVASNPYGSFVTILGGMRKSATFNMPGVTSEVIRAHSAFLGIEHLQDGSRVFGGCQVQYTYLLEWYGHTGFQSTRPKGKKRAFSVSYERPNPEVSTISQDELLLGITTSRSNARHKASIEEAATLAFTPHVGLDSLEFLRRFVSPVQDLLTLATDTPNAVEEVEFYGEQDERFDFEYKKRFYHIYDAIFKLESRKDDLHEVDMLFTYEDCRAANLNIFEKWLGFSEKYKHFCTLYFSFLYSEPRYLDEKFSKIVSAFTLLCASLGEAADRTKLFLRDVGNALNSHFMDDESALLVYSLPTASEVEMPFRMLRFLEEHSTLMSQIIEGSFVDFVSQVVDTMSYVASREQPGGRPVLQGESLHHTLQRIRWLIKFVVLKELGFSVGQIVAFAERNKYFNYLKSL